MIVGIISDFSLLYEEYLYHWKVNSNSCSTTADITNIRSLWESWRLKTPHYYS